VPTLSRRLWPIARWLSPCPNRSRKTSRIRIDNLSPGIPVPRCSAKKRHYLWLKTVGSYGRTTAAQIAFTITGTGVHDRPEHADCRAATIRPSHDKIALALSSRRDNHPLAATAKKWPS
jgi:hypothetical protein